MSQERKFEYGVLLPQFGSMASRERLVESSVEIEQYGFDSVWVRDHVVYQPHSHEDQDKTHVDPFVVLAAVAARTERIKLGTGVLIPHRHPIQTALMFGSVEFIAGPGRLEAGVGVGTYQHEFDSIGIGAWDRRDLVEEQVEILRKLWAGDSVTHRGQHYEFSDVQLSPMPAAGDVPVWYGGNSPAAVRRAVEYCDAWMPGRMPRPVYRERMQRMRRLADEAGKPMPRTGTIPLVVPADSFEDGLRYLNLEQLISSTNKMNPSKTSEPMQGPEDLAGVAAIGPPEMLVEQVRAEQDEGADLYVFDLRPRFDDYEEMLRVIGEEVLPQLHAGDR